MSDEAEKRSQTRAQLRKLRRRRAIRNRILFALAVVLLAAAIGLCIWAAVRVLIPGEKDPGAATDAPSQTGQVLQSLPSGTGATLPPPETQPPATQPPVTQPPATQPVPSTAQAARLEPRILEEVCRLCAGYNYDEALRILRLIPDYEQIPEAVEEIAAIEATVSTLVEIPYSQVYHVFFHTLIADSEVAFKRSGSWAAFNETMTTVKEFNAILQQMYDNGWVLVRLHDIAGFSASGEFVPGSIKLPPGKKAFVLSLDDISYYHYMLETGGPNVNAFARKIVIDADGRPRCEYVQQDGTVAVGDYDAVPLLESFIEAHPDFSYRGAKGCIALTGYNGILGYRTDSIYAFEDTPAFREKYLKDWIAFFGENDGTADATLAYFVRERNNYPGMYVGFDREKEREQALGVVMRLKSLGWEFASHTWGHINVETNSLDSIRADNERWQFEVGSLLGGTDIIIFAFGSDLADWHPYTDENEKFAYLSSQGFHYYCNVSTYELPNAWVQFSSSYQFLRQARANLDGYAMWKELSKNPDGRLDVFFRVEDVFDPARPTPVDAVNY
ncbi:MAG: polysaccharide deacetylase [Lachnospiraceae bacterium]|nr:polysaccharide deacetylase [Lachnospiraceae bacterium]